MGAFAVAFGQLKDHAWTRIVSDLSLSPTPTTNEWKDHERSIRFARVSRGESQPIVSQNGCIVVAEGETSEARIASEYEQRGDDFARKLSGDFVFALYDMARDRLLVTCDVVGGRTASYFWNGHVLVVSTRTAALLRHPDVPKKFDRVYRAHALSDFWAQPAGTTAFESIRRLRPGYAIVLERNALQEKQIDRLHLDRDRDASLHGERAHRAFRDLLDVVVEERVEKNACLALSGGLDSTTVASSIVRVFGSIDAVSIVDSKRSELDEHEATRAFTKDAPIRIHSVDAADDVPFDHDDDSLPIADDPAILSWAFAPTKRRLLVTAKQLGARTIVDGEGGDEVFDVCVKGTELGPLALASYLLRQKNRRRIIVDEWLAPRFGALADALIEQRYNEWFAPWMRASYRNDAATAAAVEERKKWLFLPQFAVAFPRTIEIAAAVGSNAAARLAHDVVGLASISPLLDRRIIEFFSRLPASEKFDGVRSKSFLRRASCSPAIAEQEKDTRLYCDLASRAFANADRRERLAERVMRSPGTGDDVDGRELRKGFRDIADGVPGAPLVELAAALIQYATWSSAVAREYGVR